MRELHCVTIFVNKVVINILGGVSRVTIFIFKNANLDLGSSAGADGSGIVRLGGIILRVVDHFAFKEVRCLNVTIIFHVLNLLALFNARVTVDLETTLLLELTTVSVLFLVVVISAVLTTLFAHIFLDFLLVPNGRLEIGFEINKVLSVSI